MQVNDEYIDELFACKLGNMEAEPPEDGWLRVEQELNRRSSMKRKYWLMAASVALILSVSASIIYVQTKFPTNSENVSQTVVIDEQPIDTVEEIATVVDEPQQNVVDQPQQNVVENLPDNAVETLAEFFETVPAVEELQNEIEEDMPAIADVTPIIDELQSINYTYNDVYPEIIAQNDFSNINLVPRVEIPKFVPIDFFDISDDEAPVSRKRWEISGKFAPIHSYRNITSVPAGLRKSDFDDAESPLLAYSGGLAVSFKVFSRFSIQTGAYYTQMGQSINNVTPVTNMHAAVSSNNSYTKNFVRTSSGSVAVASTLKADVNSEYSNFFNSETQAASINPLSSHSSAYQLIERVDYLEIPLTLRYKVVDRKFSLAVFGGMSANVLLDTNTFIDNGVELLKNGTILMARPINYSSSFGFSLGYDVLKNLSIGVEPAFKYYLHSYTTSSQVGSNPYAIGVFTGAVYRF